MTRAAKKVCGICSGRKFELIATKIREGAGRIMRCSECGLIMQDLHWDKKRLNRYYAAEYQRTNSLVMGKVQSPAEHFEDRLLTIQPIFDEIKRFMEPDSKVLEVGCGAGSLLSLIKPHVAKCVGIELYKPFVGFINKDLGIKAYAQDINKVKLKERFDLVISIATLDHLPNPYETLLSMKKGLARGGRIYVEVPSCEQALNLYLPYKNRETFNEFFWHRSHLFYFDRTTIRALFEKAGLKITIKCRHDYTFKNFLNWYFTGKPQSSMISGMVDIKLFNGNSDFERRMNSVFEGMEKKFRSIASETFRGESLCCTAEAGRP